MVNMKQITHDLYVLDNLRMILWKLDICELNWSMMMGYAYELHHKRKMERHCEQ